MDAGLLISTILLISVHCLVTADNTQQGLSVSHEEFTEYFYGLARNKPIDWTMVDQLVRAGQVSRLCHNQSAKLHYDTTTFKTYAIRMLDSTGKTIPPGLFQGNCIDFGSYQGCRVDSNNAPDLPADFRATYCRLNWGGIPPEMSAGMKYYVQGVCVPSSCTDGDVMLLATTGKAARFLKCFSVYNNTKKLLDTSQPPGQLPTLHGIRVISCMLIIYGHTIVMQVDIANPVDRQRVINWETSFPLYVNHLDLAADAFFLLRVTPVYAFLLMVYSCLFVYMGTGPNWADPTLKAMTELQGCPDSYWTNLLYINNYVNKCFKWAWFLAVDMQLFIVSPFILLLLYREEGVFTVTYHNRDTIIRLGPYMIGILLGYLLLQTDRTVPSTRTTKVLMLLGWMIGCAVNILLTIPKVTFCTYGMLLQSQGSAGIKSRTSTFDNPGWMAFYRSVFATSVAWLVYACSVGYGGIITEFLSWRGWAPLSRLSYAAYLVHPIIIHAYTMSQKTLLYFSVANWCVTAFGIICSAFLFALAASLMVEMPFAGLEHLILFGGRQGGSKNTSVNNGKKQGTTADDTGKATTGRTEGSRADNKGANVNEEPLVQKKED
ncbi:PREDICTED: O-acyltransferase like protein-like [Branchiostoma belcheri]|uniref:O-acyltransferase like protein-like n=1 Tax=Branchiostoma belcheri TaxID=7741 RepID=A0A6P4ZIE3_BRABE|nr:PREDICTED: O-acyltransferase like protein-like [Branchiostoma belcheri]